MRALLGYIFAVSILLGSAYAGLEWLSAPEPLSAEKSVAHGTKPADKLAPTRLSKVAGPGAADRKPDGAVAGKTASEERSDGTGQESKHARADITTGQSSKPERPEGVAVGGCAPIGLTRNGELVFSMQCQDMIERHRHESASSEVAPTPSATAEAQPAANPDTQAATQPNSSSAEATDARSKTVVNSGSNNVVTNESEPSPAKDNAENTRVRSSTHDNIGETRNHAAVSTETSPSHPTSANARTTGESKSEAATAEVGNTARKPTKRAQHTRPETIVTTPERHDAARDQRTPTPPRSNRMAARGDSDLWYNVLGLR